MLQTCILPLVNLYDNNINNNNAKSLLQRTVSPEGLLGALHMKVSLIGLFESMLETESYHLSLEHKQGNTEMQVKGQTAPQFGCSTAAGSLPGTTSLFSDVE